MAKTRAGFYVQWNPVNTDTKGTRQSVRINRCPYQLSGLILEKMYELFRVGTNETVRIIRVSVLKTDEHDTKSSSRTRMEVVPVREQTNGSVFLRTRWIQRVAKLRATENAGA